MKDSKNPSCHSAKLHRVVARVIRDVHITCNE